jgi:hypothetical protein
MIFYYRGLADPPRVTERVLQAIGGLWMQEGGQALKLAEFTSEAMVAESWPHL